MANGLLCDADTTAVTILALRRLGHADVFEFGSLRHFDAGSHFQCWAGERNPSVSANAHVLSALADEHGPTSSTTAVAGWLAAQQHADGSWLDKWHGSPYYATVTCVRALDRHYAGATTRSVERARTWVLESQRDDGSWGMWEGTAEE